MNASNLSRSSVVITANDKKFIKLGHALSMLVFYYSLHFNVCDCYFKGSSLRVMNELEARALYVLNFIWFGYIARLSQSGKEGGNFLVQMIITCLHYA